MGKTADSPCVDVCKIDKDSGLCRGCLRTLKEIAKWQKYSKKERRAVIEELASRKL
jgi:hypothetical protein